MKDREAEEEKAYKYQDGIHEKKMGPDDGVFRTRSSKGRFEEA